MWSLGSTPNDNSGRRRDAVQDIPQQDLLTPFFFNRVSYFSFVHKRVFFLFS